jgi:6-phosphogluconolactonase (cycloisomerase 2 family)
VIPDLGADLIRVFYIDPLTLLVSPRPSIPVVPGSGPRHGIFHTHGSGSYNTSTYYYLVTEIGSTLTGYHVNYLPSNGGLQLTTTFNSTTYGPGQGNAFAYNAASEIALTSDGKSLIVSNRNTTYFNITNPNPKNATLEPSDAMATFDIGLNGTAKFGALSPAGGSFPRQFSPNRRGNLVAVGLQKSGRVVIYGRCESTGDLGNKVLADFEGLGPVTSIVWAEDGGVARS